MLFYVAAILWMYFIGFSAYKLPIQMALPASIPIVAFSAFRGVSGKDTPLYINRFDYSDISFLTFNFDSEPLLLFMIKLSRLLFGDDVRGFFGLHAFLLFLIYFAIAKKFNRSRVYVLSVGPIFFIDGLVNAMRISFAYHLILFGYAYYGHTFAAARYWVLAILTHVTSLMAIFFMFIFRQRFVIVAFSALMAFLFYAVFSGEMKIISLFPRIMRKISDYSDLQRANWYSGIVDLFLLFSLMFLLVVSSGGSFVKKIIYSLMAFLFCFLLYLGIQQSIAFIRISKLAIISLFSSGILTWGRVRKYRLAILFLGLIYACNFIRQVAFDQGFLPYG